MFQPLLDLQEHITTIAGMPQHGAGRLLACLVCGVSLFGKFCQDLFGRRFLRPHDHRVVLLRSFVLGESLGRRS